MLRERQNEEKQRKLEELKQHVRRELLRAWICARHLKKKKCGERSIGIGHPKVSGAAGRGEAEKDGGAAAEGPGAEDPSGGAQEGHPGSGAGAPGGPPQAERGSGDAAGD